MLVILKSSIRKLGDAGSVVKVSPGFARNYLLPLNKAERATKENLKLLEKKRSLIEQEDEQALTQAKQQAELLSKVVNIILIKQTSNSGKLFGSVTTKEIAKTLIEKTDCSISSKSIQINDVIKQVGLYNIKIELHSQMVVKIVLCVARSEQEVQTLLKTQDTKDDTTV